MGEKGKNKIAGSKSMPVNSSTKILTFDFQESVCLDFCFFSPTKARFHDLANPPPALYVFHHYNNGM
jgi:hypothetical protein